LTTMANVSLEVSTEASAAFLAAQDDKSVRALVLVIESESIILKQSVASSPDVATDVDGLCDSAGLTNNGAAFVLFCESSGEVVGEGASGNARKWVLFSWVPDLCRPKDKMLYSSSRDQLKRSLGAGYFGKDYYCNDASDLRWSVYQKSVNDDDGGPLSEHELLKKEEAAMEKDVSTRSMAMGDIPFEVLEATSTALAAFSKGGAASALLALSLEDEKIGVYKTKEVTSADVAAAAEGGVASVKLSECLEDPAKPAYVLLRLLAGPSSPAAAEAVSATEMVFVYFCPEEAPIKAKMVYSTAKATVISVAAQNGIVATRVEEVRSCEDLDALAETTGAGGADALPPAVLSSPAATRAAPPGRGRPKSGGKKKFVADDDE